MKRKLMAFVLAAAMVTGTGITAFASTTADITAPTDGIYSSAELTASGTVTTPTIKVTVPSTAAGLVINPYKLEVTDENSEAVQDQVVSVEQEIANESDVDIQVNVVDIAATKGETSSDVVMATAPLTANVKNKSVFLYMELGADPDSSNVYKFADKFDSKAVNQIVITNKAASKANMMLLKASAGDPVTGRFKLAGAVVASPTGSAWTTTDNINVKYKFTFTPVLPQ